MLEGQLGPYLAGLIESDGNIYVPLNARSPLTDKLNYPSISIAFHVDDLPLAKQLVETLGYGNLTIGDNANHGVLSFYAEKDLNALMSLINGHMRTPKHDQLMQLYTWYQELNPSFTSTVMPLDSSAIFSNAWLSGFTEGDGSFLLHRANNSYFVGNFVIHQSRVDHGLAERYMPVMEAIAAGLKTNVNTSTITNASGTVSFKLLVKAGALASSLLVCSYFDRFPLFGSKHLNYENYRILVEMQKSGKHNTPEGVQQAKQLKNNHNRTRTTWSWSHLSGLYRR